MKASLTFNSLRRPIYVVNSADNTELPRYTLPVTQHFSFFRNLPPSNIQSIALPFYTILSFAFGNFAHYFVILLNASLSDRDKEKNVSVMGYFSREILTSWGPVVPLVCGFRRRDNLLAWHELFANLYELKSRT